MQHVLFLLISYQYLRGALYSPPSLYQLRVAFDGLLYPLRLNADVSLRDRCTAVLQEPLDKGNIIAVVLVNLRRVPFPETVRADTLIAQVVTDHCKLLLHGACSKRKNQICAADAVTQAVIFYVLLDNEGNSENKTAQDILCAQCLHYHRTAHASPCPG